MKTRLTARLLPIDPQGRILLMRYEDDDVSELLGRGPKVFWATLGGRIEEGESVLTAAAREAREEMGHNDFRIGPAVWYGEQTLLLHQEPMLFKETFVVLHTDVLEVSDTDWTDMEREVIKEVRWWTINDLQRTDEIVFPPRLAELLPDIIAGRYPDPILTIEL